MKTPDKNTYWVLPGRLLAGEYPGHEKDSTMRARLRRFLKAGVRVFIDLTEAGEKAGTLKPYAEALAEEAATLGVTAEHFRFPIKDVDVPETPEQMIAILDQIDHALEGNQPVYLHCLGGIGRTAVGVGCYLVRHGMTGEEALKQVQEWWNTVPKSTIWPDSPQTVRQCDYVRTWTEPKLTPAPAKSPAPSAPTPDLLDRCCGALLGLAVADATGAYLEFKQRGTFEPITDMHGGGTHNLKAGEWTDDTSQALILAESLIKNQGFNPKDQMDGYVRWWKDGYRSVKGYCFDIGGTTAAALRLYQQTSEPFSGSPDPGSSGNGSIMRLAPVPGFYHAKLDDAVHFAGESSKTTHGSQMCVDSCRFLSAVIWHALNGATKEFLTSPEVWDEIKFGNLNPKVEAIRQGGYKAKTADQISNAGFVIDTLESAMFSFHTTSNFRDAVLDGVNRGDDSDTVGAVVGQIAGAFYGKSGIPQGWLDKVAQRELIETLATQLTLTDAANVCFSALAWLERPNTA